MNTTTDLKLKKTETFFTRMKAPVKAKIAEIAENEGVSMSEYIERLVLSDLTKRGVSIEITGKIC